MSSIENEVEQEFAGYLNLRQKLKLPPPTEPANEIKDRFRLRICDRIARSVAAEVVAAETKKMGELYDYFNGCWDCGEDWYDNEGSRLCPTCGSYRIARSATTPGNQLIPSQGGEIANPWTQEMNFGFVSPAYEIVIKIEATQVAEGQYCKTYTLSRPVAGIFKVESIGGRFVSPGLAQLSPDGRHLLIVDATNVWLLDLKENRVFHKTMLDNHLYFYSELCSGRTASWCESDVADRCPTSSRIEFDESGETVPQIEWTANSGS